MNGIVKPSEMAVGGVVRVFAARNVQLALGCGWGLLLTADSAGDRRTAQASPLFSGWEW